jgi:DUF4097 and DUF4098 domain-containing protein YvlB
MYRHFVLLSAALVLAVPASGSAQTAAERAQERIERARESRERAVERARERVELLRERDVERREREAERRERDSAGSLDTTVTFDARGTLTVSCPGGTVSVTGTDRNEIKVRARTENGGIRFTSNGSRAMLEPSSGRGCSDGRFEVSVPAGARVSASTWSGEVRISGVHGEIEAHSQSGNVGIRDAGDRLDVESLSGDVTVNGARGDAMLHTVSGDIELTGARGDVEVETVSGDIQLRDVTSKQIRTHTTSGDVSFVGQVLNGGRYDFNTHSGDVHLQLPADIGAELSVSTFSGAIDSDFPITLKAGEHGIGAAQAKRLNFTLGQGSARIIAETFSGDIILKSTGRRR